eukprot:gb/GEZN01009050.1/.p1 GENE.gb/GEZN01009050.1/~~gb/GEZN01009050.1/.p1  ORF type:complete len:362 (+),score=31.15 gb/GEZN01009050.1/:114-1199(+)
MMKGKHKRRIAELQEKREVQVELEVQREVTRVELKLSKTTQVEKKNVAVTLPVPAQHAGFYVIGGTDSKNSPLSSVERYDVKSSVWGFCQNMGAPRCACSAAVVNGSLYVIGGEKLATVERYSRSENKWEARKPLKTQRFGAGCVCLPGSSNNKGVQAQDSLVVMGGHDGTDFLKSAILYNELSDNWKELSPMLSQRYGFAAAVCQGLIYVAGGTVDMHRLASAERYDINKDVWEALPPMTSQRSACSGAVLGKTLYVMGGHNGRERLNTVERLVIDEKSSSLTWQPVAPMRHPRHNFSAMALNGILYVSGGTNKGDACLTTERYDEQHNTWEEIPPLSSQFPRAGSILVPYPPAHEEQES